MLLLFGAGDSTCTDLETIVCCFVFLFCHSTGGLLCFFICAAVAAIIQSPLARSNAAVAEAGMWAVHNLAANNAQNKAKLGFAGCCEGVCVLCERVGSWVGK